MVAVILTVSRARSPCKLRSFARIEVQGITRSCLVRTSGISSQNGQAAGSRRSARPRKESIMYDLKLTLDQEQILRDQVIDAERPGSVLHDFACVIDFLGEQGVVSAGKYNLLPMSVIAKLDERLSRPLRLKMQR